MLAKSANEHSSNSLINGQNSLPTWIDESNPDETNTMPAPNVTLGETDTSGSAEDPLGLDRRREPDELVQGRKHVPMWTEVSSHRDSNSPSTHRSSEPAQKTEYSPRRRARTVSRAKKLVKLRRWRAMANTASSAILLFSAPLQFRDLGTGGVAAVRKLVVSSWMSILGALLLLEQFRIPLIQRWFRRHFRFLTTSSGRTMLHLFASTIALSSGSLRCNMIGLATLINACLGWIFRRMLLNAHSFPVQPQTIAAPSDEIPDPATESETKAESR